jgi:hypothetical protein
MERTVNHVTRGVLVSVAIQLFPALAAWAGECEPTYRRLGQETAEVGHLSITTSWVLIGCRAELDQIKPKELAQAKTILAAVVSEQTWGLLVLEKNLALRKTVTDRLNRAIGRPMVGDILLVHYNIAE